MRLLWISYFYPPLGGPAALRNVKTVKYLAAEGIQCDVITVRDVEYLYRDSSLLDERAETKLIRTSSLDPMFLLKKGQPATDNNASQLYLGTPERIKLAARRMFPIDDKIGWVPFLVKAGRRAIQMNEYDMICASLGPFSSALGAYRLSRQSGIPLALDLRDYWNLLSDYDLQGSGWRRRWSLNWERKVYRHASLLATATHGIADDAAGYFGQELKAKALTVYNGWDEADFSGLRPAARTKGFTLAYFGNLYARRSLKHLYAAVARLRSENALPEGFLIRLFGNYVREPLMEIKQSGIADLIETVPHLEHKDALTEMLAANILLLVINSGAPRGTLTSKLFEYLRAGKPILALTPAQGEAAELLRENGRNDICAMESAESIYLCLLEMLRREPQTYPVPEHLERRRQVGLLADRIRELLSR